MINNSLKIFWVITAILSPLLPLQMYFGGSWYSILHSYSLGMFFGIVSYIYLLNTLIIGSRVKYFDRLFGHDRVLIFHGYMALSAIMFLLFHIIFKAMFFEEYTSQIVIGLAGFGIFFLVSLQTVLFMVNMPIHKIVVVKKIKKFFVYRLRFDYSLLKFFHDFTSLAAFLITIHVLNASATMETTTRTVLISAWSSVALLLFIYHKIFRPIIQYNNSIKVKSVVNLTDNIFEIRMDRPEKIQHKAGQYGYFRFLSTQCGKWEHPFTISSEPGSKDMSVTVKKLGNYTAKLPIIKAGTRVILDGPYGKFTPVQNGNPHLFIAGGIGITPFLSIISQWEKREITVPLTLIWSCRHFKEMVHFDFIKGVEEKNRNFRFIPVITGKMVHEYKGRIDFALLKDHINTNTANITSVFICGPQSMLHSVSTKLKGIGIRDIHYEKFSF